MHLLRPAGFPVWSIEWDSYEPGEVVRRGEAKRFRRGVVDVCKKNYVAVFGKLPLEITLFSGSVVQPARPMMLEAPRAKLGTTATASVETQGMVLLHVNG